jgi:autotransporter-associated beta strand protein
MSHLVKSAIRGGRIMNKAALYLIKGIFVWVLFGVNLSYSQQDVYWRGDTSVSNWWDGANPWYYQTWGNTQTRPDNTSGTRNFVFFDNNNQTTTTVNGAFFALNTMTVQSSASTARTYNGSSGGGISLTGGIYINSSANQNFNVDIGVDGSNSNVSFMGHSGSSVITFANNFYLNGNTATFGGNSASTSIVVSGIAQGTGGKMVKNDSNALTLSGANTFTGGLTINAGTVRLNNASAAGTGTLTITGGAIDNTTGAAITLANSNAQNWNGNFAFTGTQNLNLGTGAVAMNASREVTVNGNTLTVGGAISGSTFGITKLGIGTLALNGANTFTGSLNVNAGNVTLGSAGRLASGSTVSLGGGTLTLGGNESINVFSTSSGTLGGSATLTASTYALNGGTVSANLGTGSATVTSGTTTLNGTLGATTVNVNSGAMNLGAADRLANGAAVTVAGGTLGMSTFSDTVGSFSISSGGTLGGSGTLTAATYALNGGTVSANLGEGTVNASSGTTSLSGTSAAANVNVSGGLLSLVSANRLANSAAVTVSSTAELAVGGNNTVGSLVSGGTVSGAGTLTAATYTLNGGTVSANLGAGTVNATSGTTLLSGTSGAANVNVSGGTLNTSGANKLADGAALAVSSGTLGVGGSDTVGSLAASGTGVVTVATGTTLTANGNSSITGSARATGGTVAIAGSNSLLSLANSSTTTTSDLSIGSGSTLAGTGGTSGQIKGSGLLSPGNSPGILTSGSVDLTGGIDFAFEFTAAGAPTYSLAGNSKNDLLHLTSGSTPFSGSFSTGNTVSFYFNDAGLSASLASVTPTTYLGGFFVDSSSFDIAGLLSNATKQYFIAAAGGSTTLNGVSYTLMSDEVASRIILSNVNQSGADFTTGTVNGTVLGVMAVPEPSSGSLLLAGIGCLIVLRRFRKNA